MKKALLILMILMGYQNAQSEEKQVPIEKFKALAIDIFKKPTSGNFVCDGHENTYFHTAWVFEKMEGFINSSKLVTLEKIEGQGSILRFIQSGYFHIVQVQINIEKDGKSFSMVKMSNLRRLSYADSILDARGESISENICK